MTYISRGFYLAPLFLEYDRSAKEYLDCVCMKRHYQYNLNPIMIFARMNGIRKHVSSPDISIESLYYPMYG